MSTFLTEYSQSIYSHSIHARKGTHNATTSLKQPPSFVVTYFYISTQHSTYKLIGATLSDGECHELESRQRTKLNFESQVKVISPAMLLKCKVIRGRYTPMEIPLT